MQYRHNRSHRDQIKYLYMPNGLKMNHSNNIYHKSGPKVSVVMAVYNSEPFLSETIESILNQTFQDFEFIIINDCPTDNSPETVKRYAKKDARVVLVNNEYNKGPAYSRNAGIKKAKGNYIAIIDSDDVALPERLKKQYDFLEKNQTIFLAGSGWYDIDLHGNYLKKRIPTKNANKKLLRANCIHNPTVMFRNDQKTFYRDKFHYAHDYDLWLRLMDRNKQLINLQEPLIKYRQNPASITFKNRGKQKLFRDKAIDFYHQRAAFGVDEYDKLDPSEILNINAETSSNRTILEYEIQARLKIHDFKRTRKFCKKYFNQYGFFNKIMLYYFLSFSGKRVVALFHLLPNF